VFDNLGSGFVLYPVPNIVDLETSNKTGQTSAKFFDRRIQHTQAIGLSRNVKEGYVIFASFQGPDRSKNSSAAR
jgi:hypothetical protein